jgi:hypothetical protein
VNELVGDVRKGLVTLDTVIVKFVPAFAIEFKFTLTDVGDVTRHPDKMPDVVKEHADVDVSMDV